MEWGEGSPIPPSPPREGLGTMEGLHIEIGMLARKLVPVSFLCKEGTLSQRIVNCRWRNSSSTSNSYEVITELNHKISGRGCVPQHIQRPPYAETGLVPDSPKSIEIKTDEQIAAMKEACRTARKVINITRDYIKVGVTTEDINKVVHQAAISFGAYPSPLNYKGFPKSVCTSVNNVAVHGIPDSRALQNGDIISVDVSVFIGGVHGDLCETFVVGSTDKDGQRLIDTCKQCLDAAVSICSPGTRYSWIGNTISFIANKKGFSVCSQLAGHGVGSVFHGPPEILHTVNFNPGKMERGVTFTIEPVLCEGSPKIEILEDGWTVVTEDGKRAAQFEHTVLITDTGVEVLTADEED
ncbi:methionine aminopeptidase 1D, mitochondrial-like isoform X1 [Acropora millepora]|uniref:methionine aminopeptidase 1D, mitochondrial-like isoform X1 n=1 Tax=Acropora millepora TaxID=45264 RepID=UPI001CF2450B|nr:methionine aminopeptidase 1D, mitochondrial-like isoform X1 [Acropora millepora]